MTAIDLLTAVVRGDATEFPESAAPSLADEFVRAAEDHNLAPLVAYRLRAAGTFDEWPGPIHDAAARTARQQALVEAGRETDLQDLAGALHAAGVPCLWFKGAALAHRCYRQPWLRPRSDSDVLIRGGDREAAERVLTSLGYKPDNVLVGDIVGHQMPYAKAGVLGQRHTVDLHWKISNRPLLAEVLSFDELARSAIPLPGLGGAALCPGDAHALVIACLHPVIHHKNSDNLLWSHDIHLLASGLGASDFNAFTTIASEKRVAAICAAGLDRARHHFHTPVPDAVMQALARSTGEPSAAYLSAGPWRGDVRLSDLRSVVGLPAKLRLIREVALPGGEFMLRTYGYTNRALVPVLHVHRLFRGTYRLLHRLTH